MTARVSISDVSGSQKAGVKGPRAAAWLADQGIAVPSRPNTWAALPGGALIGRLAETEFFLEGAPAAKLAAALDEAPAGVYPVPRQDCCFALAGEDIHEVLLQVCSVDFQSECESDRSPNKLFMTSMVGVAVLAILQHSGGAPVMKIWADPTFGPYLWSTLFEIVQELTGEKTQ